MNLFDKIRFLFGKSNIFFVPERGIEITKSDLEDAQNKGIRDASAIINRDSKSALTGEQQIQSRWKEILSERATEVFNLMQSRHHEFNDLKEKFRRTKIDYEKRGKENNFRTTDSALSAIAYVIIVAIIILPEYFVNKAVFNIFGEKNIVLGAFSISMATLLALGLSAVITVIAHFIGVSLKSEKERTKPIIGIVSIAILLVLISWLRLKYFKSDEDSIVFDFIGKTNMDLGLFVIFFFMINLLCFGVSIWASYKHSDSEPMYIKAKRCYDRELKRLNEYYSFFKQEIANLHDTMAQCKHCLDQLIQEYRTAYLSKGKVAPNSFDKNYDLKLSDAAESLNGKIEAFEKDFEKEEKDIKELMRHY